MSAFDVREGRKWGKPCYTIDGKNVVIIQGFKEYCALGFFQGALLKDPKRLFVQLGQVQAARVMKFTNTKEIVAKAATIKAYVCEAMAAEKAGLVLLRQIFRETNLAHHPHEPADEARGLDADDRFDRSSRRGH